MLKLIKKEFALALHPTCVVFLFFAAFVFIPNYPYEVMFFFSALAAYFVCLTGRENKDLCFTCALHVEKKSVALARVLFFVILQLALVLLCALFSAVKTAFLDMPNAAGMEANAVLAANGLVMLGIFNAVFFPPYFREPEKIGKPFVIGAVALFLFVAAVTACCFAVPFVRDVLDTPDPEHFGAKLIYLAAAALIYAALTSFSALRSMKNFEKTDL